MKRKAPALITLALIFTVFSGCGNKTTPTAAPSATPSAAPTAAVSTAPAASSSPFVSQAVVTKAGTLHNSKAGIDVALGTKKDDIDKALGTPSVVGSFYYYASYSITVGYTNDVAVFLSTASPAWETMDKVINGTSFADVKKIYGEPASGDTYGYYFDKNSKQISSFNDAAITVLFKIENDKVININLLGKA